MEPLDFELAIRSIAGSDYDVSVLRSPAGEAHGTMRFPFDGLELQTRLQSLEIALLRSGGTRRQLDSADGQKVRDFGRDLFDALIQGDVRSRFDASLAEAERTDRPLRIRLRFDAPALAALPWEFLYDQREPDYLVLSTNTPLVRYIEVAEAIKPLTVTGPLRILGMVASPTGLTPLDVERERTRINDATAALQADGRVEVHWLDPATPRELQAALRRDKWHIFHFAGHGGFDPTIDEGVVAFVDEDGAAVRVPATQLGRLLGDHNPLRLAVLNACEGARGSTHDLFSSTAATLVRRGTPAVVAMQYEITDDAAKEFGRSFYEAVADGSPVDIAVAEARKSLSIQMSSTLEWGTPVLFMRTDDGVLFRMRRSKPKTAVPPVQAPDSTNAVTPTTIDATPGLTTPVAAAIPVEAAAPAAAVAAAAVASTPTGAVPSTPTARGATRSVPTLAVVAVAGVLIVGLAAGGLLLGRGGTVTPSGPPASAAAAAIGGGAPTTKGTIGIGLELMPSKSSLSVGIANGVKLALAEAGGTAGGWKVQIPDSAVLDDGGSAQRGAANIQAIVDQPSVVAVIGPQQSAIASGQIPITNAAGLLQCSPSTASDGLTKPDAGALKLRSSQPTRINFVRAVSTNSADAPGTAKFVLENLRRSNVYVVDNTVSTARQRADLFSAYFAKHGGTVGRGSLPKDASDAELTAVVADVTAKRPDVLFFSGSANAGTIVARFFNATRQDFGAAPFVASGEIKADTTFRDMAGANLSTNVFISLAAADDFPGKTAFASRYQAAYGVPPDTYSATAHACATVVLDAIGRAGDATDLVDLRERVRSAAVDPSVTHTSVIGDFKFDANGDPDPQIITIYRYVPSTSDWAIEGFVHSGG